ncbi:acyltransferase [Cooperia oncophora]
MSFTGLLVFANEPCLRFSSSKRVDLQGIRGIAISYVLIMHIRPQLFRIGFIGVDMFFVLSGFLMTKILREKEFSLTSIRIFYSRRFKRIIPLYILVVVATYIYGYFYLLYPDRKQLLDDLQWVCTFSSNLQPLFQKLGYWDQVTFCFYIRLFTFGVVRPENDELFGLKAYQTTAQLLLLT